MFTDHAGRKRLHGKWQMRVLFRQTRRPWHREVKYVGKFGRVTFRAWTTLGVDQLLCSFCAVTVSLLVSVSVNEGNAVVNVASGRRRRACVGHCR